MNNTIPRGATLLRQLAILDLIQVPRSTRWLAKRLGVSAATTRIDGRILAAAGLAREERRTTAKMTSGCVFVATHRVVERKPEAAE